MVGGKSKKKGGDTDMRSHLHTQINRKVSHFIVGEEGKVGSQSAFTAAAFIGATSLAGILLGTPNAAAEGNCGPDTQCDVGDWCCLCWDEYLNAPFDGCVQDSYDCEDWDNSNPGLSCWVVN